MILMFWFGLAKLLMDLDCLLKIVRGYLGESIAINWVDFWISDHDFVQVQSRMHYWLVLNLIGYYYVLGA